MKRRHAYLLIACLLLCIAAYLLWAARPFLIRPGIVFEDNVPYKEREIVKSWVKESGGYGPERFRWDKYLHLLMRPYDDGVVPAVVEFYERDSYTPEHVVVIKHPYKPYDVRITYNSMHSEFRATFH